MLPSFTASWKLQLPYYTLILLTLWSYGVDSEYLEDQRLVMPGYSSMQDIIGQALTHDQERLATILSHSLSGSDKDNLHQL